MFTINIYLRFALIAVGLILGPVLWAMWGFWYGFPFLLLGIIMLAGYILLGTVMSSLMMIQASDFAGAEKQLALTRFPQWLIYLVRSQFYLAQSTLSVQKSEFSEAETWIKKALATGFSSDNEKAIALLQLAGIAARRNNRNGALAQIAEIKKLNVTEKMVLEQVKLLETNLKQMQQSMNPSMLSLMGGRNGFRMGGSKRPRPKQK